MKIAKFGFSLFGINTYVVWDTATGKCAIIDPGMINRREQDALKNFIEKNSLSVEHIINTHLHIDHAIGVSFVKKTYDAPVSAHKDDKPLGNNLAGQARMFGIEEDVTDMVADRYVEDGDIIKIGDSELKVIHVPGHSPGSIALYDSKDGFLIAGDIIFSGSIGRTDLPGGNTRQLLDGIRSKIFTLPDSTVIYPGHGPATTVGEEKRTNPFF